MKNIAFIGTEYQQNILFAICSQESIHIDVLFLRENISLHADIDRYVEKIVYFENIPFSWRSIGKYYHTYHETIAPNLNREEVYRIFVWSLYNPLSRYAINYHTVKSICWIDEGSASYASVWPYNYSSGPKDFLASAFIFSATNILSLTFEPINRSNIESWTLFGNSYPNYTFKKNIIDHTIFQHIIKDNMSGGSAVPNINKGSAVFISSAYVEYGILNEDEFVETIIDAVDKMKSCADTEIDRVYWKSHPRSNERDERVRLGSIASKTKVDFELLPNDISMEAIALENHENELRYYSLGSSSLYVIKALVYENTEVCLVESDILNRKSAGQVQMNMVFKSMGIKTI